MPANKILSLITTSILSLPIYVHAVENKIDEIRYSPFWCPRPEEISEISKSATLTMRGCCIEKATLIEGSDRSALKPWKWREYTGSNSTCNGVVLSESEAVEQNKIGQSQQDEMEARQVEEEIAKRIKYQKKQDEIAALEKEEKAREALFAKMEAELKAMQKARRAEEKARLARPGVRIGMTKQEVLNSNWGAPNSVNRTTTAYGTREQWIYGDRHYLYFEDARVVAIQD